MFEVPPEVTQATYIEVWPSKQLSRCDRFTGAELECVSQTRVSERKGLLSFYGLMYLSLAFFVFAWGTSYKLSLYNPGHESSPAKVCTRGSDAAKSALDQAAGVPPLAQTNFCSAPRVSLPQGTDVLSIDRLRDEPIIYRSPLSRAPILYLRPPPDQRFSLG